MDGSTTPRLIPGLKIDFGDGPPPATTADVDAWNLAAARSVALKAKSHDAMARTRARGPATTPTSQRAPRARRATSRARARSPGSSSGDDPEPEQLALPHDLAARLIHVLEAAEAGDVGLVIDIARDLVDELPLERGPASCRWCSLTDWPGLIEKHERVVVNVVRCMICTEAGAKFCSNHVECNARARARLGIPPWQIKRERGRDLATYNREHGGRR